MTNISTNPNEPRPRTRRAWIIWIIIFCGILVLILTRNRLSNSGDDFISQYQFEQLLEAGQIVRGTITYDQQKPLTEIAGTYYKNPNDPKIELPFRTSVRLIGALEEGS